MMIPVTKPFLPPKEEYEAYLNGIWERQWLTNMGPLSNKLEQNLKKFLKVENLLFVTNGTIAIQMCIKALELTGEIITTPFSFVATTSSISWEGCKPVFVDIDPLSLNIDAEKIDAAITDKTSAILATHVYGNPCDVEKIEMIAQKYNLKVIYDAAHAFGVQVDGKSIFDYGHISTCSLHATKLYHSIEGGLIISKDDALLENIAFIRNFGFNGPEAFVGLGINGKNSEFHAAMGLVNLEHINSIIEKRKAISSRYDEKLDGLRLRRPLWHPKSDNNYAYYPVIFDSEEMLMKVMKKLDENKIYGRRYFYPSLANTLPYVDHQQLEVTSSVSDKVLCLPLYYDLEIDDVDRICSLIQQTQKENL